MASALVAWLLRETLASFHGDHSSVQYSWLIVQVLGAFLLWSSVYMFLCYSLPKHRYEWHCRLVTVAHAILVSGLAIFDVLVAGRNALYHKYQGLAHTQLERFLFTACLGYFLFDLLWCLYFDTEGPVMLFHHCASIIGLSVALAAGKWGPELAATVGGSELTNPLLQLRWFMRERGQSHTWQLLAVELTFFGAFGTLRLCLGGCLAVSYLLNPRTDLLGRLGAAVMWLLGAVFFGQMCRYCLHRCLKWRAKTDEAAASGDCICEHAEK